MCRVPIANRAGHQTFAPDVKTGCISCCSGDGVAGGPLWWNTPIDPAAFAAKAEKGARKRGGDAAEDEAVKKRLTALAGSVGAGVD